MLATPVEVKKAYKAGTYKKNYRFRVLDADDNIDFIIDNDTLVAESVRIDERMASGSELKFGLCEGSSLEFQYFNHENINGRRVQAFIDIDYENNGWETVKTLTKTDGTYTCDTDTSYRLVLPSYADIELSITHKGETTSQYYISMAEGYAIDIGLLFEGDVVSISSYREVSTDLQKYDIGYSIPLGFFTVKECPRQFSTGIYKVTAYNKLQSDYLEQKANLYIDELPSDNSDPDKISVKSIMDELLKGYANITVDNASEVVTSPSQLTPGGENLPSFKLISDNTTYYPTVVSDNAHDQYYYVPGNAQNALLRYEIKNGEELKEKFDDALDFLKTGIISYIQSGQSYWETNMATIVKHAAMHVVFSDGKEAYYGGELLLQTTPASNVSYRNIAEVMYLQGLTTNTSVSAIEFMLPLIMCWTSSARSGAPSIMFACNEQFDDDISVYKMPMNDGIDNTLVTKASIPDVTLREIISANYETLCQYGQLDRETDLFSGVELNNGGLYPAESLYPANTLYPNSNTGGNGIHPYPSEYSQLWTDTMGEQSFRYLIITYKTLDENNQEVDAVLQRTVNANGTTDYNMSDNWLFRNLVWTAADVGDYAYAMVTKMQNIRWFPFEMWAAGLPYVETGDAIEITDRDGATHISYILQRQLQGIQNLQDTYVNGELDIF